MSTQTASKLAIRNATAADVPLILDFIRGLAEYERAPEKAIATEADLLRDGFPSQRSESGSAGEPGFSSAPKFRVVIAEWEGKPAGFAFFFFNYSTWNGKPGLFLEDLFVRPEFRGKGIGKALLVHLAKIATRENCGRFDWNVLDWNTPAIEFYKSLGANTLHEWLTMRVEGEALKKLASSDKQ